MTTNNNAFQPEPLLLDALLLANFSTTREKLCRWMDKNNALLMNQITNALLHQQHLPMPASTAVSAMNNALPLDALLQAALHLWPLFKINRYKAWSKILCSALLVSTKATTTTTTMKKKKEIAMQIMLWLLLRTMPFCWTPCAKFYVVFPWIPFPWMPFALVSSMEKINSKYWFVKQPKHWTYYREWSSSNIFICGGRRRGIGKPNY